MKIINLLFRIFRKKRNLSEKKVLWSFEGEKLVEMRNEAERFI